MFYVFGQFDPLYLFVNEFNLQIVKESYWFFLFRLCSYLIVVQWMLHNARACIFITVGMNISFIKLLLNLKRESIPTPQAMKAFVQLFRELSLILNLLTCLTNAILEKFLGLSYFLIATGICCLIFGIQENDFKMILVFSFMIVVIFCALLFLFKIGSFLHSSSKFILERWKKRCSRWQSFEGKVLLREIDSCRLLMLKAGDISVITIKLQQGFLNALLQDSATTLLLWKNKFDVF